MQRTDFSSMPCPIARGLERVGEWWSMLILRDAFAGVTRFEDWRASLGIAPGMLSRRLTSLVEAGLLEKRRYSTAPPRDEYVLTARGEDFRDVLIAMLAWGNRHFTPDGKHVVVVDTETGEEALPVLVDGRSGRALRAPAFAVAKGRGADRRISTASRLLG
jgi:DNA-binding HxlR family transcriptional regulator